MNGHDEEFTKNNRNRMIFTDTSVIALAITAGRTWLRNECEQRCRRVGQGFDDTPPDGRDCIWKLFNEFGHCECCLDDSR